LAFERRERKAACVAVLLAGIGLSAAPVAMAISGSGPHPSDRPDANVAAARAAAPTVTVRVEGATATLLPATTVHTRLGYVTSRGAPSGACRRTSALGALQTATHGGWSGRWSAGLRDYFITTILGDTEGGKRDYWELLVDNVAASTGACGVKLRSGEQLLFAAVSTRSPGYPLVVRVLSQPVARQPFAVQVAYYNAKGVSVPLAGATVTAAAVSAGRLRHPFTSAETDASGTAEVTVSRLGLIELGASRRGYVRAAEVPAQVAGHAPLASLSATASGP
jgi:hypothetical protein